jgi:hypothetical protein
MVVCLYPRVNAVMTVHGLHGQHGADCLPRPHVRGMLTAGPRRGGRGVPDKTAQGSVLYSVHTSCNLPEEIIPTFSINISDWGTLAP